MSAMITAHVQHDKMHMCPMRRWARNGYSDDVENEKVSAAKRTAIRAISRWRDRVLSSPNRRFDNAAAWAKAASISPTTITRGMGPDAKTTLKIENLHLLAEAAGAPSIIDYLHSGPVQPGAAIPSDETLAAILRAFAPALSAAQVTEASILAVAQELGVVLQTVGSNDEYERSPERLQGLLDRALVVIERSQRDKSQSG